MKTTVQEIMTTRVIWVSKDATFREMAVALREHRVSAFPVVDQRDRPRDRAAGPAPPGRRRRPRPARLPAARASRRPVRRPGKLPDGLREMTAMNATVKDVMTADVVAVRRDTTFKELAV